MFSTSISAPITSAPTSPTIREVREGAESITVKVI